MPATLRTPCLHRQGGVPRAAQLLPQQERPGLFAPPNVR